jgi:hypothetical protein
MGTYILTGAGFSKNFGGLLSNELEEFLCNHSNVKNNDFLKKILEKNKGKGFEESLAKIECYSKKWTCRIEDYKVFQATIHEAFEKMDKEFSNPTNLYPYELESFLAKFDAIFTTNQDMLIERQLQNLSRDLAHKRVGRNNINGLITPGLRSFTPQAFQGSAYQGDFIFKDSPLDNRKQYPDETQIGKSLDASYVPYIKLHGSFNWYDEGENMMIMGSQKDGKIQSYTLLKWYFELFKEKLFTSKSKLLIIGYSFSDVHINEVIFNAVENNGLQFFIWTPSGKKGVIKTLKSLNQYPSEVFNKGYMGECTFLLKDMLNRENPTKANEIVPEFFLN